MSGKVFLKRNIPIQLKRKQNRCGQEFKFKMEFSPVPTDVIPVSKNRNGNDSKLAEQLKYLLSNNEGEMGDLKIEGEMQFYVATPTRPAASETMLSEDYLTLSLKGDFPWFLNTLRDSGTSVKFEIHLNGLIVKERRKAIVYKFTELYDVADADLSNENIALTYQDKSLKWKLNTATWDNLFAAKPKGNAKSCPNLSLVVCANISQRMNQAGLIIGPGAYDYRLSTYQTQIVNRRNNQIQEGKITDAMIVGQNGKEWNVHTDYLTAFSPVFAAMLENDNFEEGRTKRINLAYLDDKIIECLLEYLNKFELPFWEDHGLVVQMLEVAERFQIQELVQAVEEILMRTDEEDLGADNAIQLFAYVRHLEHFKLLKFKALQTLRQESRQWRNSGEFKKLFRDNPDLAWDLITSALAGNNGD